MISSRFNKKTYQVKTYFLNLTLIPIQPNKSDYIQFWDRLSTKLAHLEIQNVMSQGDYSQTQKNPLKCYRKFTYFIIFFGVLSFWTQISSSNVTKRPHIWVSHWSMFPSDHTDSSHCHDFLSVRATWSCSHSLPSPPPPPFPFSNFFCLLSAQEYRGAKQTRPAAVEFPSRRMIFRS